MASSSSSSRSFKYDVFLSFRGEDTRKTFVDHLYKALEGRLVRTYKDDITLPRGESVGPALLEAIQESHIAVVIFSKNYADSSWCLDELSHIIKCRDEMGLTVIPVFYDMDPSDVRKQKGEFGKAFAKQESENVTKAASWRKALVHASNISGWEPKNVANGHDLNDCFDMHDLIQEMGHYIVRGEHPNNPEKHSRVWKIEEINNMCLTTMENDKTEVIYRYRHDDIDYSKIVPNMKKLRWLIVRKWNSDEAPTSLSNELRYIQWDGYPGSRFPGSFQPTYLAVLKMVRGLQKELWKGWKNNMFLTCQCQEGYFV